MFFVSRETSVLQITFHVFQKNSTELDQQEYCGACGHNKDEKCEYELKQRSPYNHPPVDELFIGRQQPGKSHKDEDA